MLLDLHKLIGNPGTSLSFEDAPELGELDFDGVLDFAEPLIVTGKVTNHAGALVMDLELRAKLRCVCARCTGEFTKPYFLRTQAMLSDEEPEDDEADIYLLEGDNIDTEEVVNTAFFLSLDQVQLCSEDCKGLCSRCGKNLNDGPCDCKAEADPRLAVLGQLLEE